MTKNMPKQPVSAANERPTVGVVLFELSSPHMTEVFPALVKRAREREVNMFYFPVGYLGKGWQSLHPRNMRHVLLDLIDADMLEGILPVQYWFDVQSFETFYAPYQPLPVVNALRTYPGYPGVAFDDCQAVYQVVSHLIAEHHYRRIACLGLEGTPRYPGYADALADHGIALDPALIFPNIRYRPEQGPEPEQIDGIFRQMEERHLRPGQDIDAIVLWNDGLALPLMEAFQQRGIAVPEDIAVVGFDNVAASRSAIPPLTTVAQRKDLASQQALDLLLARIEGQERPEQQLAPTQMIVRRSCGCFDQRVAQARATLPEQPADDGTFATRFAARRDALVSEILEDRRGGSPDPAAEALTHLIESFAADLAAPGDRPDHPFLQTLDAVLRQELWAEREIEPWQERLSALRQTLRPCLDRQPETAAAENLWQQARRMIALASLQARDRRQLREEEQARRLRELEAKLISTFDIPQLMAILAEELPQLGFPACYLALYDDPLRPADTARLMLAYGDAGRAALAPDGHQFPSRQIVPPDLRPHDRAYQLVVEPLFFQEVQIGLVVFEVGSLDNLLYEQLRTQLSSALQGALLVQRVQERTAEIARQKYILDAFMANVPERIYFKDRASRYTQANQSHARRLGLADPAEQIGKTDFDWFSDAEARRKYELEQQIIQTGEPVFDVEEPGTLPDGSPCWALTTKMPLRDETGAIIGTFGITRDITPLKMAQQALQQAYSEITILNSQLQTENVRMSAELNVVKQLQQMILPRPQELANITGLDIAGYMQPADEVGGDYYDVLHGNGLLHIGIGDVTGHGLESGVIMLMTQAAIRTLIEHGETDPVKFVNTLNRLIYKNVERMGADKNLTFALVQYQRGQFKLVGQHEELLVVRQNGEVERVDTVNLGFPVGLQPEITEWVHAATITLNAGDGIVLYTDGITEAENIAKQQYGLNRLCAVISKHWNRSAKAIQQAVVQDVLAHIGAHTIYDDITLVVVKQQ